MNLPENFKAAYSNAIHWENPHPELLFYKFVALGDDIKTLSSLIIRQGQGALLVYKGKVKDIITEEGCYEIETCNQPFVTTLKKITQSAEIDGKTGIWFFHTAEITNCRWSTMSLAKYLDPENKYPAIVTAFGHYSLRIHDPALFFTQIVQKDSFYYQNEIREAVVNHISHPMTRLITKATSSGINVDLEKIAEICRLEANPAFNEWGFELTTFQIEGPFFSDYSLFKIRKTADAKAI